VAIAVVVATVAVVASLPIPDASKLKLLFGLGLLSLFVGYALTLRRIPPKSQTRKPATVKPITHDIDVCSGCSEINRNLCQYPAQPSQAVASNNPPTIKQARTISALIMRPSLQRYLTEGVMCYNRCASHTSTPVSKVGVMRLARTWVVSPTRRIPDAMRLLFRHTPIFSLSSTLLYTPRKILSNCSVGVAGLANYVRLGYIIVDISLLVCYNSRLCVED
jgi:hypothetical protein